MNDRYRDRYGSYEDERYDDYADSGRSRSSRSGDDRYDVSSQGAVNPYSRHSGNYRSSSAARSSAGAGAYADDFHGSDSGQRVSQSSDGGRRHAPNLFEGYYSEDYYSDDVDAYRRSAASYSSRRSGSADAGARSRYARQDAPAGGFSPARPASASRQQGGRDPYSPAGGDYEPKRTNRKRVAIIAAIVVLAVVLVGAGAAWAYVNSISNNLHEGVTQEALDALEPAAATETSLSEAPFYMLLLGVDMSGWRRDDPAYADDKYGRSDSMMLARIDPVNKKAALISIHRDTMVNLGEYGQQKINAAYEFYGPAGAIQAVSTMAGVPISHYATVDFDGFSAIVDAIGGVEVNVPMEINDEVLPCHIDAGLQVLDGETALDLCRSRHSYDDVADDGDVMRAANQRMVISAVAKKILASDLMTIANSVQTLSKYVTTDLELSDIVGLAQIFKDIDPATDLYTAMEPTTSAYIDETWYEFLDEEEWKAMIARMDQGLPPVNKTEIDERTGTVLSTGGSGAPVV